MKTASFALIALVFSTSALAQSQDDKRASLRGITQMAVQESGVELGGRTPAEDALQAAGIRVVELEKANAAGLPIFDVHCMERELSCEDANPLEVGSARGAFRVTCEGRFLRQVFLGTGEKGKLVYATTWISPMSIVDVASRKDVGGVSALAQHLADTFVKDWREANPGVKPAPPAKKK